MSLALKPLTPFGVLLEAKPGQDILDLDIGALRSACREHQIVVLRGFKTFQTSEEFARYCDQWGEVALWPFGKVLELIEQKNPQDHIFDHSYVPMHWDGMYRPQVPEFQVFHCVLAPPADAGGRTTFSHTPLMLKNAKSEDVELWRRATAEYSRKMEYYQSKTVAPIVCAHPVSGVPVIRYCETTREDDLEFINHPDIKILDLDEGEIDRLHQTLKKALYSEEAFYAHTWQTGDVVFTDNFTLLHGREAFVSGSPRHLQRVHILGPQGLNNPHLVEYA